MTARETYADMRLFDFVIVKLTFKANLPSVRIDHVLL